MSRKSFGLIVLILMTAAMSITAPAALSKEPASVPTTTVNIKISVPDLKILLTPLTQSELAVEVDAWQRLVKDKVTEISRLQIQSKTVEGEEKQKILDQLTRLREERTALIDRFNAVLRELNAKGGDVATYEKYVKAVSGIDISSDDALSSWSAVRGWLISKEGGIRWIFNIVKFILILLAFMIMRP